MSKIPKKSRRKSRPTKDRVLQARIPRDLDDELRGQAEQLGLSVSTVVRNVLLNTFQLVEGVVSDSASLARVVQGRKPDALPAGDSEPAVEAGVIGWQEAVLNQNGICEQCNCILQKGERAAIGVPVTSRPALLCLPCLESLAEAAPPNPTTQA